MSVAPTLPQFLILGLALANFASFIWAVARFFRTQGKPGFGFRVIRIASPLAYAIVLYTLARPAAAAGIGLYAGIAGFIVSLTLFFAALRANRAQPLTLAYDTDMPEHLNRKGPYAWIRHPFYAAYLLAFVSGWIGSGADSWLALVPVFFFALYWDAASREEAKFMQSPLAGEYRAYQAQAGRFWPKFTG